MSRSPTKTSRVASAMCDAGEPLGSGLLGSTIARVVVYAPQAPERLKLGVQVIQGLGDFKRLGQYEPGPFDRAHCVDQRNPNRDVQVHCERWVQIRVGLKTAQRTRYALGT